MNHYDTLGVDPGASKEAIKHSYRLKALKYHPDRSASLSGMHQCTCRLAAVLQRCK